MLSRREFIQDAAIAASGIVLAGCGAGKLSLFNRTKEIAS